MATIREVAAEAGVSKDTALNVFRNRAGEFSEETRVAVVQAANRLGYVYHPRGVALSGYFGVRVHPGRKDPDTGMIGLERINQRAERHGTDRSDVILQMLTYADQHMPLPRSRKVKA